MGVVVFVTVVATNKNFQETTIGQKTDKRDRLFEKTYSIDSIENPLKSSIAENIREWDSYKAVLFQNQAKEKTIEHLKFDNMRQDSNTTDKGTHTEGRTISRDIDPRADAKILEWILKATKEFLIYKDIKTQLDRFFYTLWEELPRQIEDENTGVYVKGETQASYRSEDLYDPHDWQRRQEEEENN